MVTPGSIQHIGENTLEVSKFLTDGKRSNDLFDRPLSPRHACYFDWFGKCRVELIVRHSDF